MRKSWVGMLLAAALSLAVAAPVLAATPFVDVSMDKGTSAYADAGTCIRDDATGDETCVYRNASLFDGWSRYNGERFAGKTLCAGYGTSSFEAATHTSTESFTSGCLEDANIVIAKDLLSASGAGTVQTEYVICTYDNVTGDGTCSDPVAGPDLAIDLVWTGSEPVSRSTNRGRDVYGDCVSTYSSKGSWSDATVTGTFDGAPAAFDYGQITQGKGHWTTACH